MNEDARPVAFDVVEEYVDADGNRVSNRSSAQRRPLLRAGEPRPDWQQAEAALRQIAPHVEEVLPGVRWHIVLEETGLRLRFTVPFAVATIRLRTPANRFVPGTDEACFEIWSTTGSRCVDMLALLPQVDALPGWRAEAAWRRSFGAENSVFVDLKLTARIPHDTP